jgi:hypothetical protein
MTRPPQPQPYPGDPETVLPGRVLVRLPYADALGQPMTGVVTVINRARLVAPDGTVVPASSVRVDVPDGWLSAHLLPATYQLKAQLRSRDGGTFVDDETITVHADGTVTRRT